MAKLNRITAKVFGETASPLDLDPIGVEIGQVGSANAGTFVGTTDIETLQALNAYTRGLADIVRANEQYPTLPELNGILKVMSYQTAYNMIEGIAEYDIGSSYSENCICKQAGTYRLYGSRTNDNIGNDLSSAEHWQFLCDLSSFANLLSELDDVNIDLMGLANNQALIFNGNTGKWENKYLATETPVIDLGEVDENLTLQNSVIQLAKVIDDIDVSLPSTYLNFGVKNESVLDFSLATGKSVTFEGGGTMIFQNSILTENGVMGGLTEATEASDVFGNYELYKPWNAFRDFNDVSTPTFEDCWLTSYYVSYNQWITYYTPVAITPTKIKMKDSNNQYPYHLDERPKTGAILGSNDNINWETLTTYTNPNTTGIENYVWEIDISTNNSYKYIRNFVNESYHSSGTNPFICIYRMQVLGTIGVASDAIWWHDTPSFVDDGLTRNVVTLKTHNNANYWLGEHKTYDPPQGYTT